MILVLAGPLLLALVHVTAKYVRIPARWHASWVSFASGAAIAYVFIHILPDITRMSFTAGQGSDRWTSGEWVFATALAGTCGYYAVESLMRKAAARAKSDALGPADFSIHILAFALYNVLIGYMIVDYPPANALDAVAFYGALGLHFFLVDHNLRTRHQRLYDWAGRWIMAGAVLLGATAGVLDAVHETLMIVGFSFLAGGMVLNVLKDELPADGEGRIVPFIAGAGLFGLLFVLA